MNIPITRQTTSGGTRILVFDRPVAFLMDATLYVARDLAPAVLVAVIAATPEATSIVLGVEGREGAAWWGT